MEYIAYMEFLKGLNALVRAASLNTLDVLQMKREHLKMLQDEKHPCLQLVEGDLYAYKGFIIIFNSNFRFPKLESLLDFDNNDIDTALSPKSDGLTVSKIVQANLKYHLTKASNA